MSDSVLDLIDHVIDAHGDAMRWSPNAPDPTLDSQVWQWEDVAALVGREGPYAIPMGGCRVSLAILDEAFGPVSGPMTVARQARLRRMRHLYRQRRR